MFSACCEGWAAGVQVPSDWGSQFGVCEVF